MSSTTTTLLGLYKETPGTQEPANMALYNANFDTLDNAVTLAGSQTLTNKTLTSPTLNTPTLTSPTVSSGTLQLNGGAGITLGATGANTAPALSLRNTKSDGSFGLIETRRLDSNANKVGFRWANVAYSDGWDFFLPSGNTGTSLTLSNIGGGLGFTFDSTPSLAIGASAALGGALRLPNNSTINWRNAANSADLELFINGSDQLAIQVGTGSVGTSVGSAGAATAIPASPTKYLAVVVNGTPYHVPLFA